jgi:hypothetical protein
MFGTRLVYLLLAFILSFAVSQPFDMLFEAVASTLPGGAGGWLMIAGLVVSPAVQFFAAGVLFTLLSGLSWKRAAPWTIFGTALLNLLCAGRAAFSPAYLSAELLSVLGVLRVLSSAAAGVYGCWFLEEREMAPWVEQARAMILSMIGQ